MKQVEFKMPLRMLAALCFLLLSASAIAQQIAVNGHVKDATGEPIIGATVRIVGEQGGAATDIDGNFTLSVSQGAKLQVSYIGYQTQEVTAQSNLVVVLQEDAAKSLNEVVVIGYGAVKKSDLTGSVAALKPDSKNKGLVVNPQDMLAGKVAGVSVISNSGQPGAGAQMRIRGGSSLSASNDPLIVIDGVAMDNTLAGGQTNILSSINPQDIESFNVLKDASATAIYGSRGSNGVIIITTKKGRKGQKPQVSYSGSFSISTKKKTIEVMDGNQYRQFIAGLFGEESDQYQRLGTANTNWQDLLYRTALSHDHNVTVAGSVGTYLPYRVSVGYTNQQGIIKKSDYQRVTASLNLNPSLLDDHLVLNLNAKGMYSKNKFNDGGAIGAAVYMDPTQDPYSFTSPYHTSLPGIDQTLKNFGGYFEWTTGGGDLNDATWPHTVFKDATKNPLALLNESDYSASSRQFIGSADIDYKVHGFEDLRLHLTLGADVTKVNNKSYQSTAYPTDGTVYYGRQGAEETLKRNLSLSAYAQYFKDFNENHHFDVMAGYEWSHFWRDLHSDYVGYYPETNNEESNRGKERPHVPYRYTTDNYMVSFFGRANYTLMNRYMLTATIRDDGSSRFKEHWAWFPAFAFAWKVNEEPFMKSATAFSDLKLRLGWGKTGQQSGGVDDYGWIPTYDYSKNTNGFYPLTGEGLEGGRGDLSRPANYNSKLKWETTTTTNIGIDWGLMRQRLTGSIDWYYRKITDLLNYAPVPAMGLFKNMAWQNVGSLRNTGIEATISFKAIQSKDLYWTIDYNFTYNNNKITNMTVSSTGDPVTTGPGAGGGTGNYVQANQKDYPANSFWVYQQAYDANGNPIENVVVDRNGDGQITFADRYLYKSPMAPVTMGLSSRIEYKNWDLGFAMRASIGNYVFNDVLRGGSNLAKSAVFEQSMYLANRPVAALDRNWQTYDLSSSISDYYVQNASFLKMDNITLGYSFANLFRTGGWSGIGGRVYATVNNVFTITKYKGIDPEIDNGVDQNIYPRPTTFIIGLNLNF